jgi:intein-encoded DNA endonuclease-like protein
MSSKYAKRTVWTQEMDKALLLYRDSGNSFLGIAEKMGLQKNVISNRVHTLIQKETASALPHAERSRRGGISNGKTRDDKWAPSEDAQLLDLYMCGSSSKSIAGTLGRTVNSVQVRVSLHQASGTFPHRTKQQKSANVRTGNVQRTEAADVAAMDTLHDTVPTFSLGYVIGVLYGDGFVSLGGVTNKGRSGTIGLKTRNRTFAHAFCKHLYSGFAVSAKPKVRLQTKKCLGRVYKDIEYFEVLHHDLSRAKAIWAVYGPTTTFQWTIPVAEFLAKGRNFCRGVLRGFFDSEGYVSKKGNRVEMSSGNTAGMESMRKLLHAFGHPFSLSLKGKRKKGARLRLSKKENVVAFATSIGSDVDYKAARLEEIIGRV